MYVLNREMKHVLRNLLFYIYMFFPKKKKKKKFLKYMLVYLCPHNYTTRL